MSSVKQAHAVGHSLHTHAHWVGRSRFYSRGPDRAIYGGGEPSSGLIRALS